MRHETCGRGEGVAHTGEERECLKRLQNLRPRKNSWKTGITQFEQTTLATTSHNLTNECEVYE